MRDIILADNQDITASGLKYLLQSAKDIGTINFATTKKELIVQLSLYPEALVILDYTLFDFQGVDDLLVVRQRFEQAHWIMFSDELSNELLRRLVFGSQVFSIVIKSCGIDEINAAVFYSLRNERFICNRISNQLLTINRNYQERPDDLLTGTEKEILREIAAGRTTKEIAAGRSLSFHTVITHRKNIFRKIDVNNIHEATKYAIRAGIVDLTDYYI
ncbi:MAG: response regulator transcription factor [Dysgonamonadaceae bacterium]|jgi:DNA-binding NarL/FixJ family response regulator|nr:response regulator transcription factor [Dysgonamonadaceae bacterium]